MPYAAVSQFLKAHRKQGFCNACLAKELALKQEDVAAQTMRMRNLPDEFTRWHGECSRCKNDKNVVTMAI
jgi:hypothetical protein